jgi:aromatic ring-opening dioxygenase LigB subunit
MQMITSNLLENFSEMVTSLLEQLKLAWWLEIVTDKPHCIYYFGPFTYADEAQKAQLGYIEDLEQEHAQVITVKLKRHQPQELTTFDD